MKKPLLLLASLVVLLLSSCGKEHQCKCEATEGEDAGLLHVFVVDRGIKCGNIKEMAYEQKIVDENGNYSLTRTGSYQVKCRDYYGG